MLILNPVVELMGNEHTNIYNVEKLNISFGRNIQPCFSGNIVKNNLNSVNILHSLKVFQN